MCLAAPAKVISVSDNEAVVDYNGVRTITRLDTLTEPLAPGDYVLIHTGFAIRRLSPEDGEETLKLFDELADSLRESAGSSDEANSDQQADLSSDEKALPSRADDAFNSVEQTDLSSDEKALPSRADDAFNSVEQTDLSSDEKALPSRADDVFNSVEQTDLSSDNSQ